MASTDYRFGEVEVHPGRRRVLIRGKPAALGGRAFDVLLALLERRERVVTKHELLDCVWPGLEVEENNLVVQVGALRKALGPTIIATIPGRGYRFVAPESPPPAAGQAPAVDSMAAATSFVGRVEDTKELLALVREQRLVTVAGPSGVGKSRLARHVVGGCGIAYADGIAWVDLAVLTEPSQVCAAIARSLGLQLGAGDPLSQIVRAAGPLSMLVALDNAEHLVEEVARVAGALLSALPGMRLVVTSQVALSVPDEHVMRLGPLAVPLGPVPPAEALGFDAVALFVQRAQAASHRFSLDEQNVEAVIEICRRLDGLPLAIELAAARVPLLGTAGLASALDERLKLLGPAYRRTPARQRTLRAALEWSWGLLAADERVVLRRLGVCTGSFSLEMAQAVAVDVEGGLDAWTILDVLGTLVDRSLVMVLPGEPSRYRLLESMRALALERLQEAGEVEPTRRRHAHAVLARFEQVYEDRYAGRMRVDDSAAALAPDTDNALEAVRWSLRHDVPTALALMQPLTVNMEHTLRLEISELWTATSARLDAELTPVRRARWLMGATKFWGRSRPAEAAEYGRQAVALLRGHDPAWELYLALASLATAELHMDARHEPEALREMLAMERPQWAPAVRYMGAGVQAHFRHVGSGPQSAFRAYQQQVALLEQAGDSAQLEWTRMNLMDLALLLGHVDDAIQQGLNLLPRLEATRRRLMVAVVLLNLTAAWLAKDDVGAARATAARLLPMAFQESIDFRADLSTYLAVMAALQGQPADAVRFIAYGDRVYAETGTIRQGNEALAAERASQLARVQLGDAAFEQETRAGTRLSDAEIEQLAARMLHA